jgi:hypothetical protein
MGGRVWAKPRPEGGSEFGFSLGAYPDDEIADAEAEAGTVAEAPSDPQGDATAAGIDGNAEVASGVPSEPAPPEDHRTEAPPARV